MTDRESEPDADDDRAGLEDRAGSARRSYARMRAEIEETIAWLAMIRAEGEARDLPKGSEVAKAVREYDHALRQVVDLEGRMADAERLERGGGCLDLDAARAEILDRIARRAARG